MNGLVPGRIVYFVFDAWSAKDVVRQRERLHLADLPADGNAVQAGDIVPAMVVRVWDTDIGSVNLKVILDGPDTYWATSVTYSAGKRPRSWHWMYSGQATRGQAR